jgi:hypothetical protein
VCNVCSRSYARRWVLARHYREVHGLATLADSIGTKKKSNPEVFPLPYMLLMTKLSEQKSAPSYGQLETTMKLAYEIGTNIKETYQKALESYIIFPKAMISGFSCYLCPRCVKVESLTPIKDLGIDFTSEGRHRCPLSSKSDLNTLTQEQRENLKQLAFKMFSNLEVNIQKWIPGKKIINAQIITVVNEKDDSVSRKGIEKKYDIPKKYHLEEVDNFERSPWVLRLLRDLKLEPTPTELTDFYYYCVGTYAIFRTPVNGHIHYYKTFLTPALN